jgi:hypothetical protein
MLCVSYGRLPKLRLELSESLLKIDPFPMLVLSLSSRLAPQPEVLHLWLLSNKVHVGAAARL